MAERWVRAGWAVVLLTLPGHLLRAGGGGPVPATAVAVARALGLRHLAQAALSAGPTTVRLGALADTVHAGSCVGFALGSPRWRRVALADALIETGFAAAGLRSGWSRGPGTPRRGTSSRRRR
ncbi:hypothetical protein [Winogradskya consettensis]|uniref:hypothetical protein n=1 Tax=Winogradskya consettensis TaxID=113560 RepID=UPI001BB3AEFB|nr:hypothetical protein [Actinoplanes consettensis]